MNEEANPDRAVKFGTGKVEIAVSTLTELLKVTDHFADAFGELDPGSELDVALKRLGAVTTSAVLPHVIDTLERNGGRPGRTLPYLLEFSAGRRLEEPADRPARIHANSTTVSIFGGSRTDPSTSTRQQRRSSFDGGPRDRKNWTQLRSDLRF